MMFELTLPILAGWIAGWIVNYLADVLPITRRLDKPACRQCGVSFSWAAYLSFRRCPDGHGRSPRLWLVQIAITAMSVYAFLNPPLKIGYWAGMVLLAYFGVVFVIDVEHRLIMHPTSVFGALLALTLGIYSHGLAATLSGGLAGFLILITFYLFGILFTKMREKQMKMKGLEPDDEEAFGQGDVILATILGFLVGWPLIWFAVIVGIFLAGGISVLLVASWVIRRQFKANALMNFIPLGPYYILGAALVVYFPDILRALLPG